MSFDFQTRALTSNPRLPAAGIAVLAVVLTVVAQSLYERRKRVGEGRSPMVSHLIPWVGSALEIGGDPDTFFDRAR